MSNGYFGQQPSTGSNSGQEPPQSGEPIATGLQPPMPAPAGPYAQPSASAYGSPSASGGTQTAPTFNPPAQPAPGQGPTGTGYSYAPPSGWNPPTQQMPAYTPAPQPEPKKRGWGAGVVALMLLSALVGGAAGAGTMLLTQGKTATTQTVNGTTKVVQGSTSAPDWTVTAAAASPSVVSIMVVSGQGQGQGSGVVWDGSGNVVTNNHVVAGAGGGGQIRVSMGEKVYAATLVGTDPSTDLAVIKISGVQDLKPMARAKSVPKVGEPVMAVGNPLGLSGTVTTGIVSALNRPVTTQAQSSDVMDRSNATVVTNAIQTSAPINPGNSGGALVNANAELVGINSSIASLGSNGGEAGNIGIGFAIPCAQAEFIAEQLIKSGKAQHSWLGVSSQNGAAEAGGSAVLGAKIVEVVSGSPADKAGLKVNDVITGFNEAPVASSDAVVGLIRATRPGESVKLKVQRGSKTETINVTLGTKS